jgi:hypothetical protein
MYNYPLARLADIQLLQRRRLAEAQKAPLTISESPRKTTIVPPPVTTLYSAENGLALGRHSRHVGRQPEPGCELRLMNERARSTFSGERKVNVSQPARSRLGCPRCRGRGVPAPTPPNFRTRFSASIQRSWWFASLFPPPVDDRSEPLRWSLVEVCWPSLCAVVTMLARRWK